MKERKKRKPRKKLKKWLTISILAVAALLALALSPLCTVREVTVEGNQKVSAEEILEATGVLEGQNIFRIGVGKIEEKLESIPYVKQAKINRLLPDKLQIVITETDVEMYIPFAGKMAGIDVDGKVIELIAPDYAIYAPVINGVSAQECEVGKTIVVTDEAAFQLAAQYIGYFKEYDLFSQVTELDVSNPQDIQFTINYKLHVQFGTDEQLSYKMKYLEQVVASVDTNQEGVINIRSLEQVTHKALPETTEVPEGYEETTESPEENASGETPVEG